MEPYNDYEDAEKDLEIYEQLRADCVGNRRLREMVYESSPVPDGDRLRLSVEFVTILHKSGYSPKEIQTLVCFNRGGVLPRLSQNDSYTTIRRIIAEMDIHKGGSIEAEFGGPGPIRSLTVNSEEYIRSLSQRKPGISTGLLELDKIISGLKPGKLYIFAARPGMGKTSLITQILTSCADQGTPCLYYPTEVGAHPLWDKMVSSMTNIGLLKFQDGSFSDSDKQRISDAVDHLKHLPLKISEDFAVNPDKVEAGIIEYLPEREGSFRGVCAVDFLQSCAWKDPDSVAEKTQAVYRFKKMAIDYNIPFILASQLNRGDGSANLKQLKGTGALEEFGDVISFIYPYNKPGHPGYPIPTMLDVMKSKYSATGQIQLFFAKSHCRFEPDISKKDVE